MNSKSKKMKIDKELDSKLRKLLTAIERPLTFTLVNCEGEEDDIDAYNNAVVATQLREEIIAMLNSSSQREGKYRQIDLEEAIEKEKKDNKYY